MIPRSTGGAGVNSLQTGTNNINYDVLEFDAATQEFAQFFRVMPNNWTSGTITSRFYWTVTGNNTGSVVWGLRARSYPDNTALDLAFSPSGEATDTVLSGAYMHISPATSAITITGTNAPNNITNFEVFRDATDVADTLAVDAQLIGAQITFN
jgi:hypothetical protein